MVNDSQINKEITVSTRLRIDRVETVISFCFDDLDGRSTLRTLTFFSFLLLKSKECHDRSP